MKTRSVKGGTLLKDIDSLRVELAHSRIELNASRLTVLRAAAAMDEVGWVITGSSIVFSISTNPIDGIFAQRQKRHDARLLGQGKGPQRRVENYRQGDPSPRGGWALSPIPAGLVVSLENACVRGIGDGGGC